MPYGDIGELISFTLPGPTFNEFDTDGWFQIYGSLSWEGFTQPGDGAIHPISGSEIFNYGFNLKPTFLEGVPIGPYYPMKALSVFGVSWLPDPTDFAYPTGATDSPINEGSLVEVYATLVGVIQTGVNAGTVFNRANMGDSLKSILIPSDSRNPFIVPNSIAAANSGEVFRMELYIHHLKWSKQCFGSTTIATERTLSEIEPLGTPFTGIFITHANAGEGILLDAGYTPGSGSTVNTTITAWITGGAGEIQMESVLPAGAFPHTVSGTGTITLTGPSFVYHPPIGGPYGDGLYIANEG